MSTIVTTEKPADTLAKSATSTEVTFTPGEDLVVLSDPGSERAESIGALIFGPSTYAMPHSHIAQRGSRRAASRKDTSASAWLNA